jgi:uncharacterized protein (DUF427 family)
MTEPTYPCPWCGTESYWAERTRRRHADALWRAWHKHGQRW